MTAIAAAVVAKQQSGEATVLTVVAGVIVLNTPTFAADDPPSLVRLQSESERKKRHGKG